MGANEKRKKEKFVSVPAVLGCLLPVDACLPFSGAGRFTCATHRRGLRIAIASQIFFGKEETEHQALTRQGTMATAEILAEAAPEAALPSRGLDWDIDQPWVRISSAVAAAVAFVVLVVFFPDHEKSLLHLLR